MASLQQLMQWLGLHRVGRATAAPKTILAAVAGALGLRAEMRRQAEET